MAVAFSALFSTRKQGDNTKKKIKQAGFNVSNHSMILIWGFDCSIWPLSLFRNTPPWLAIITVLWSPLWKLLEKWGLQGWMKLCVKQLSSILFARFKTYNCQVDHTVTVNEHACSTSHPGGQVWNKQGIKWVQNKKKVVKQGDTVTAVSLGWGITPSFSNNPT